MPQLPQYLPLLIKWHHQCRHRNHLSPLRFFRQALLKHDKRLNEKPTSVTEGKRLDLSSPLAEAGLLSLTRPAV